MASNAFGSAPVVPVDDNDITSKLMAFYQIYKPEKATQVNVAKIVTNYRGNEIQLFQKLFKLYNVPSLTQQQFAFTNKSSSTPTNGHQSSSPHDSSHHNNITTFSTERIQISPMRDSKKRGRNTETDSNPRKASLFHRPWEAYPSARERQFRRDGQTQQHGHAGRRRSKSARYQYETGN